MGNGNIEFDLQRYLENMDRRLDKGINLANHRILVVDEKLTKFDKRLIANEASVKWLSRILVPTFLGLAGWGVYGLAHAVFAAAARP